ncbi:MAG: bifunctional riboflavin kinase/FAD synthetase [Actinomycetota bacterium]
MRTLVGLEALEAPEHGSSLTIGTFDGVHLGHRALIARALARASGAGAAATVVTWDRHPDVTLRPERTPPLLTPPERKIELIAETGVEVVVVLPFDEELSRWSPERFVADVLVAGLGARHVSVGAGWRFGRRASGDVALLQRLGERHGLEAESVPLAQVGGAPVSSSRVRAAVAAGDLDLAHCLLGRPFDMQGIVVHGAHRGRSLGYPTANLVSDPRSAHPPRGVYAGVAVVEGSRRAAAINVGVNPTFGGEEATTPLRVEAYLLDFDGDLYGRLLRVEFHRRLRDELRFDSVAELVEQMARDVEETREPTC